MVLNLLQRFALCLIAEDGDVGDSSEADGGEEPEHAGLGDAVRQRLECERDDEGEGPVEERGHSAGNTLHLRSKQFA